MRVRAITFGYTVRAAWRRCPMYFLRAFLEQLRRAHPASTIDRGSALEFGQVIHKGLEVYYAAMASNVPQNTAIHQAREAAALYGAQTSLTNVDPASPRSLDHAGRLLQHYFERYPFTSEPFVVKDVEKEVDIVLQPAAPDTPAIIWRVHIDGLVQMVGEEIVTVFEHKTTSGNPADSLLERMLPNDQIVGYSLAAQHLTSSPSLPQVLFNGLCSDPAALDRFYDPTKRAAYAKRTKKEPFDPFLRTTIPIQSWMVEEWKVAVIRDALRIVEDIESNTFSRNAPDACTLFNTRCQFADLCKSAPDNRASLIEFCYDKSPWKGFSLEVE